MLSKTTARVGEVIERVHGGCTGAVNPPTTHYFRVVNEDGQNGFYGSKEVVETNYDDFKRNGTDK